MRTLIILLPCFILLFSGCNSSRKTAIPPEKQDQEVTVSDSLSNPVEAAEKPIVEVEEKLVPVNEQPPDPFKYFVIIGSFRIPDNAIKFQEQARLEGFFPDLLKNENGLLRVSVMSTNNIREARNEILRIREKFSKYFDTWLLIQVK